MKEYKLRITNFCNMYKYTKPELNMCRNDEYNLTKRHSEKLFVHSYMSDITV